MDILKHLNEQQQHAVTSEGQHVLVVAGAGSGKTRVLVDRVAWLIQEKNVSPNQIFAVTFTNKAAKEMRSRIEDMLQINTRWMWIGTFHALCTRMLRMEGDHIGIGKDFVIFDDTDSRNMIKRILTDMGLTGDEKNYHPSAVLAAISDAKNKLMRPADYFAKAEEEWDKNVAKVYERYQTLLKTNHVLDFDDLLTHALWMLEEHPEILARYQQRFPHILVDEYQDTNHCQYRLIRLLAGKTGNVFAVGDPDQSIYRWRGADISNILDFTTDYPDAEEIPLTQNYRSTQNILDAANSVIANNISRKEKELFTQCGTGEKIELYHADNDREEALYIIRRVLALQAEGQPLSDFAVLYRTHGQSRLFEDACIKMNIPYRVYGGMKFYDRKEVKDTLAYLRLLINPHDDEALRRVYNEPRRGIGVSSFERLQAAATEQNSSLWDVFSHLDELNLAQTSRTKLKQFATLINDLTAFAKNCESMEKILHELWQRTGYTDMIMAAENREEKAEILEQLVDTASDFDASYEEMKVFATEDEPIDPILIAFLSQLSLATDLDQADLTSGAVTLMTLHAAKGLEFPVVFLVGMEEGVFPHKRVVYSFDEAEMEEERRLCYVGITRAKKLLILSTAARRQYWGTQENNKPSRFLKEIPEELLEHTGSVGRKAYSPKQEYRKTESVFAPRVLVNTEEKRNVGVEVAVGDRLRHAKFGDGVVVSMNGSGDDLQVFVAFPGQPVKQLMWKYAPVKKI